MISKDKLVRISYVLRDSQGILIDASDGSVPIEYLHGHGQILPRLEESLDGRKAGDVFSVIVPPIEGYGIRNEELVEKVSREQFHPDDHLEVGLSFAAQTSEGELRVVIAEVNSDHVVVDGNHPLAGVELHFEVKVEAVRDISASEARKHMEEAV